VLALLALIAFVIGLVKIGSFDPWAAWLLLGLIFLAADAVFTGFGGTYPRFGVRR
jgi:hypothetical protein